jgi:hypothetical protein
MLTRSQTNLLLQQPLENVVPNILLLKKVMPKQTFLKVDIDFEDASKCWKSNKKSIGNGCYKYICTKITKKDKQCKNDSLRNCEWCRFHNKN